MLQYLLFEYTLFYPLDSQKTKKTKKTKTKMLSIYKQQSYFSQIVSKEPK